MKKDQITQTLKQFFFEDDKRIVYWSDPDGSFTTDFNELALDGVTKWRLDEHGPLATKLEIEHNLPRTKFLLYQPDERPEPQDDWLLDVYLYAEQFSADRASVLLNALGLQTASMVGYLSQHLDFFNSQERTSRCSALVQPTDREADLDLKILAVLSNADFAQIDAITLSLFAQQESVLGQVGFHLENGYWDDIRKFNMADTHWRFVKKHWGYTAENPTLKDLFFRLTVTHLRQHVAQQPAATFPDNLQRFVLPAGACALNASVFITNWMQNAKRGGLYAKLSEDVELELNLDATLGSLSASDFGAADTFEIVEKHIVVSCLGQVMGGRKDDLAAVANVIDVRRDRFWCGAEYKSYARIYDALSSAVRIFSLKAKYEGGFKYDSPEKMYEAYTNDLFAFDQAYRHFYLAAADVKQGLDVIKTDLLPAVENLYCNWYMPELALAWGKCVENELLESWSVAGVPSQRSFYADHVAPILKERDTSKAFVIIADAMRYEIAEELNELINREDRIAGALSSMLAVLPSCTATGMAALLPHREFSFNSNAEPLIDGQPAGAANREKILQSAQPRSKVVKADDLLAMTTKQGRAFVKDCRVIYIYHDRIDAVGDKQATEENTFEAAASAVQELKRLVEFIHGSLNGSRILVTADHGFLFQMGDLASTDKNTWVAGGQVKESKKRYVLGSDMPAQEEAWTVPASVICGTDTDLKIVVPKGAQRFHFTGGARFVHGGALLQEVVVPVIKLRTLKGKAAETGRAAKVDVQLLDTTNRKVSNNRQRFTLLQTTKVEGKTLPRTLRIGFQSAAGELISDEHVVTFDSNSDDIQDRQRDILFALQAGKYDRNQDYYLVLTDDETGAEYNKIPFRINLGIGNEFGEW